VLNFRRKLICYNKFTLKDSNEYKVIMIHAGAKRTPSRVIMRTRASAFAAAASPHK
jgi:hypothetical protein